MKSSPVAVVLIVAASACATPPPSGPSAALATPAVVAATTPPTTLPTTSIPATTTTTTTVPPLDTTDAATLQRLRADLAVLMANGPRVSGSVAEEAAAEHFARQVTAITGSEAGIETFTLPTGSTSRNVWSSEVGRGGPLLVIGSHLDSVASSPGADDNASGAVVILELLRRLVEDPPTGLRVVVVGFGAEETIPGLGHHHGSRHAAARLEEEGGLPDLMLSVDMVGFGRTLVCGSLRGHDGSFADEVAVIAVDAAVDITRRVRGEISDHAPFARAGVPSAHLWRDGNPAYHTPNDDEVSDAALAEGLRLLEAMIAHLSPHPPEPPPGAGARPT